MKHLYSLSLMLAMAANATAQYYPLPSPCDPDKVFSYLPNASFDNVCVFHLNINKMPYKSLPGEIFNYPNIQDIAFTNCGIKEITVDIPNLKELEVLDLSDNNISTLPATLGECKKLKKLILKNNNLTTITGNLVGCTSLEEIDISGNPIAIFPSVFTTMPKLKVIKASAFKVKDPVAYINSIKNGNITSLDLSNCNLNYLPSVIKNFTFLKELNLSNNNIAYLTDDIAQLPSLEKLDVSNNKLLEVPASLCNMLNLKMLKLNNNKIKSLPQNFGNLKNINFDVSNNIDLDMASQNMLNGSIDAPSTGIKEVAAYKLKSIKTAYKVRKRRK